VEPSDLSDLLYSVVGVYLPRSTLIPGALLSTREE